MHDLTYRRKRCSADDVAAQIPKDGFIYVSGNAATPQALLRALATRAATPIEEIEDKLRVGHVLLLGEDPFPDRDGDGPFRHHAWFVGPADRDAVNHGNADYVPVHLHQIPRVIEAGPPMDAALLSVSPPDRHGYMSLGVEVMASMAAARHARRVVVQVNAAMPRVHGDCFIHVDQVDCIVEADEALPERPSAAENPVHEAIAGHITKLVPDGATLQLGIGGVPDAVLRQLHGRRDLGLHSEMVGDGLLDALEDGVVTGRRKTAHLGKVILTFALGTRRLYDFLADNPLVEAHPCSYVNDPTVIARNDRMVAVNQALQIDLTGQVCSDSLGTRIYSGVGGQVDFLRGAALSRGGVPIVAVPSTARGGQVSRIAPLLTEGAGVVTTRADVHWVVTEFGAVNLFGRCLRERAEALISIAHPEHRGALLDAAQARHLL